MFVQMCEKPIQAHQMITEGETIILDTGLFANQYEQWQSLPPADRTWPRFEEYWTTKIDLWIKCGQTAHHFGYGGNVEEGGLDDDICQAVVADFVATGSANAKTFENLSTTSCLEPTLSTIEASLSALALGAQLCYRPTQPTPVPQYQPPPPVPQFQPPAQQYNPPPPPQYQQPYPNQQVNQGYQGYNAYRGGRGGRRGLGRGRGRGYGGYG